MTAHKLHAKISEYVAVLQRFVDRLWYPPLLGLLAAADNFIVVIPNDGLLISSSMLRPRRWLSLAIWIAIGSTLGAFLLAVLIEAHGMPWVLELIPGLDSSSAWVWTERFFDNYGLIVVFLIAATPLPQQPAVILATISSIPLWQIVVVVFIGRLIKFLVMAYISTHAPRLITRIWGIRGELEEVGIKVK